MVPVREEQRGTQKRNATCVSWQRRRRHRRNDRLRWVEVSYGRSRETHSSREGLAVRIGPHARDLDCCNSSSVRVSEIVVDSRKIIRQADAGIPTISAWP